MKDTIELFAQPFMLTGKNTDPKSVDFTFNTSTKIITGKNGMPAQKKYYMNYDADKQIFSELAVQCTYTYTSNAKGALEMRVENIEWFFEDGEVGTSRQVTQVYETV